MDRIKEVSTHDNYPAWTLVEGHWSRHPLSSGLKGHDR